MMVISTLLLVVLIPFFLGCVSNSDVQSVIYYIDANAGNDDNSGISSDKPWRSFKNIEQLSFTAGNNLLLKRGSVFNEVLRITAEGEKGNEILIDAYGEGNKPLISAPDSSLFAVLLSNCSFLTFSNLEIVNTGSEPMPYRTGIKVEAKDYGVSQNITLMALDIRDVNGSRVKSEGGGSGILIESKGDSTKFDNLIIEHCTIKRCERNGMIWSANWSRDNWYPSTNVQVRYNSIEEVPGDGIVPIGCDGAIVEFNKMYNCPATLPDTEAAAGIWPWSCDNTLIQYNEVSDHKAPWDAQGFDSDYNCTNTTIQYNYSHDNEGGFILVCNSGESKPPYNIGNKETVVQYNISIDDAVRTRKTRVGIFSPTIHIAGPTLETLISHNVLFVGTKANSDVDRSIITSDSWNGYADKTTFNENLFIVPEASSFRMTQSTNNSFENNYYFGEFHNLPNDKDGKIAPNSKSSYDEYKNNIYKLLSEKEIADGKDVLMHVDEKKIKFFFDEIKTVQ